MAHQNLLGKCQQPKIRYLHVNFSTRVFVWGLEACLSTDFVEGRALYEGKLYLSVASLELSMHLHDLCHPAPCNMPTSLSHCPIFHSHLYILYYCTENDN